MSHYIIEIETRVAGIPAIIGVSDYKYYRPDRSYRSPSSEDFYGGYVFEYDILDKRGRKAEWLERKLTNNCRDEIDELILSELDSLEG
jgi:hypothetical protein